MYIGLQKDVIELLGKSTKMLFIIITGQDTFKVGKFVLTAKKQQQ